jgi:arsenate reductase-like glutaredoxin family protein
VIKLKLFSSNTCVPCKNVEKLLTDLGANYQKILYEDDPDTFAEIGGLPCLVLYNDSDEPITRVIGFNATRIKSLVVTQKNDGKAE